MCLGSLRGVLRRGRGGSCSMFIAVLSSRHEAMIIIAGVDEREWFFMSMKWMYGD